MAHTPPGRTRERVRQFVRERLLAGDPPTVREVQEAFGFRAVESARAHLEALVAEGFLAKAPGRARGYRLAETDANRLAETDDTALRSRGSPPSPSGPGAWFRAMFGGGAPLVPVPLLGRVQAGALTTAVNDAEGTAVEDAEGALAVQSRAPAESLFALRVRGDSMRGAGILDGDLVVVRRTETAEDGQIVVALVGDEATVKRLRKRRDRTTGAVALELHPENPAFPVIVPPPGEARLLGRVIEVRRMLDGAALPAWEDVAGPPAVPSGPRGDRGDRVSHRSERSHDGRKGG